MMENRPEGHRLLSNIEIIMMDEQITAKQLIENRKVMTTSKEMIMNIGITSVISRPKRFCIYYYYSTHRNTYVILREATSETYRPGCISIILISRQ